MLQGIFMHSLIMHLTWLVKSTAAFLKPYLAALKTYQVILLIQLMEQKQLYRQEIM